VILLENDASSWVDVGRVEGAHKLLFLLLFATYEPFLFYPEEFLLLLKWFIWARQ